jgi:tetratricopeptide (TPR) repeat protein
MGMWPALADRHAYVAAIGPIVAVVWGVADLLGARARSLAVAVVVGLAALTARQVRVWKDNVSLFARAVEGAPEIALFRYMLGTALATATPPREAEAIPHLQEAIRLEPSRGQARANLGRALAAVGRDEEAEATLRAGLALAPQDEAVGEALGELLLGKLRNAEAAVVLERAVAADPANARAQGLLGEALNREGRFAETIARGEALPGSVRAAPDVRFSIGVAYASTGRIADARAELTQLRAAAPALAANLESYLELVPAQGATAPRGR